MPSYRELQAQAKQMGIAANQSKAVLEKLLAGSTGSDNTTAAAAPTTTGTNHVVMVLDPPATAVSDLKLYRRIRLPNGLEAMLISDNGSAAADEDEDEDEDSEVDSDEEEDEGGGMEEGDEEEEDEEEEGGGGKGSRAGAGGKLNAAVSCGVAVGMVHVPPTATSSTGELGNVHRCMH
jgi:hypothetical protein